jgi:TonB-linked SusC/RagA family outer membrane protein
MHPIVPLYDVMGNYSGTRAPTVGGAEQPIFLLDKHQNDFVKRMDLTGNIYVKLNIMPGLSFRSLVGVNHYSSHGRRIDFNNPANSIRGKYDILTETGNYGLQWTWTNTLEYSKTVAGLHDLKIIIGSEAIDNTTNFLSGTRENFFSTDINFIQLSTGLQGINNSGGLSSWSLFSVFGRFNYTFSDKYMLEGVVRRDGSSRFGGTNKYGIFPAFSAGWRISNENFMSSTNNWLDELKLRAGYGTIGNDRMGNYNSYTSFALDPNHAFYPFGGSNSTTGSTGFLQQTFGNPNVRWETTKTSNIGLDATLFTKFNLMIDLWRRVTTDMLYPKTIPMVMGRASAPSINIGEMKNRGFDIELGYRSSSFNGDLNYDFGLAFSHYKNEIVKLTDKIDEFMSGSSYREMIYTRSETGRSFPEFYGYIVEGIFQTQAEADEHAPAFGSTGTYNKPGHYKFKDVNNDDVVDASDRTYIGSPHPDFTVGLNINVGYKGFNLMTQLFASYGNELVNYVRRYIDFNNLDGARGHARLYESWGSPYLNGDNSKATLPLAELNDIGSQQPSTAFVDDASYLRMRTLRLSYDLNNILGNKFRSLQVYGQVSNLFTLTKYPGLDPEIGGTGINMGIDSGAWPTPRQFLIGITLDI